MLNSLAFFNILVTLHLTASDLKDCYDKPDRTSTGLIHAPKDYLIGPVFAAHPQTGSREVTVGNRSLATVKASVLRLLRMSLPLTLILTKSTFDGMKRTRFA